MTVSVIKADIGSVGGHIAGLFVAGGMSGLHNMPLMPVRLMSPVSYFDGPPVVSCAAFSMHNGRLTRPFDAFDHPFWDTVRQHVADKAMDMRNQGSSAQPCCPWRSLNTRGSWSG
jgi:fructose 1,6-bisphosphate aldolase/phosphatase